MLYWVMPEAIIVLLQMAYTNTTQSNPASLSVTTLPIGPTLNVKSPNLASVCDGQSVSSNFSMLAVEVLAVVMYINIVLMESDYG